MKSNITKILLAFFLLLHSIAINAYDFEFKGMYFVKLKNGKNEVAITYKSESFNSYSGDVHLSKMVYDEDNNEFYIIKQIGDNAFKDCTNLTNLTFDDNCEIEMIGKSAFQNCTSLRQFNMPQSVIEIKSEAFSGCSALEYFEFGDALKFGKNIYFKTFFNCRSLKKIDIPESVEEIGESAFENCISIKKVIFEPLFRINVRRKAFAGCTSLEAVYENAEMDVNGYEYVDLDLPSGNLWSKYNLGASGSEEHIGGHYAPFDNQPIYNYLYRPANRGIDPAQYWMGGDWRVPTKEDFEELIENCHFYYYSNEQHSHWYWVFTRNGKSIVFPSVNTINIGRSSVATYFAAQYWTCTPKENSPYYYYLVVEDVYNGTHENVAELKYSDPFSYAYAIKPVCRRNK